MHLLTILQLIIHTSCFCKNSQSFCSSSISEYSEDIPDTILPGAYDMEQYLPLLQSKSVGLVINHSSLIGNSSLVDSLLKRNVQVKKIFAPEHGFRGDVSAGSEIPDTMDIITGLPIISLYGKYKKPTKEQLQELDILLFDIQDVGVRFFTYISTLHYIMEACAETGLKLIILDRPNPNGHYVDGPVLKPDQKSFIGIHPIPIVYGLTIGELAKMIIGEGWIDTSNKLNITIIPCLNYTHHSKYKLPIKPSPNLPNMLSVWLYPGMCLFEGTSWSLGRGTNAPFQIYGHPDSNLGDTTFVPIETKSAKNPPHVNKKCKGFSLRSFNEEDAFQRRSIYLDPLLSAYKQMPDSFFLKNNFFNKLVGNSDLKIQIQQGLSESQIRKSWEPELDLYLQKRKKYLLYKD